MLAYDYPLLGVFWSMLWWFLFSSGSSCCSRVHRHLPQPRPGRRRQSAVGPVRHHPPVIGVLVYLIARGHKMHEHAIDDAQRQDAAMRSYVQSVAAPGGGTADELAKLADLRNQGVLDDDEFARQKAKLLA